MEHKARGQIFYEEDGNAIKRTVEVKSLGGNETVGASAYKSLCNGKADAPSFDEFYDISGTLACINQHSFERVALQFPDEMLGDAYEVSRLLSEGSKSSVFILGDTSYGSCCVDEVAGGHLNAQLIVHYGRSCLSRTSRIPVYYVFGRASIDTEDITQQMRDRFSDDNVTVFYDLLYEYAVEKMKERLSDRENIRWTRVKRGLCQPENGQPSTTSQIASQETCGKEGCCQSDAPRQAPTVNHDNRPDGLFGRTIDEDIDWYNAEAQDGRKILWIGQEGVTLNNIIMSLNRSKIYSYSPITRQLREEGVTVNRSLMKRYNLIQQVMDAQSVGIVVGTLGVGGYLKVIDQLKRWIRAADKKLYTFIVGKLNIAKMANFAEIDVFVLVACPENSLVDSRDFYKPIVTPFEVQIALQRGKEWSGKYVTDFSQVLRDAREETPSRDDDEDEDEMRFSIAEGRLKPNPKAQKSTERQDEMSLTERSQQNQLVSSWSHAGQVLAKRDYRGLEMNVGETVVQKATQGMSGLPMVYTKEKTEE
ncbi:hypothetical protein PROFUN_00062 [Planoprotostelium fungivorum]|uniref:2-(3-amino-3-carboxypropyl)histidine synthase subunit 2 n=1 Tax=Planoprotostelium fungivorum TaxID=1890364 RepID=A0A2P6P0J5_9EUKA|nr:hypothetical protein PROFUN_00062 [Planoprotostelium fungivorum]